MAPEQEIRGLESLEKAQTRPAPTGFEGENLSDAITDLITTYHSLNPPTIDILTEEPSPLQFLRYVTRNRPFIIRNGAQEWKARKKWNAQYLTEVMQGQIVNVAITPKGNADSIIHLNDDDDEDQDEKKTQHQQKNNNNKRQENRMIFIKPHETTLPFPLALSQIQHQQLSPSPTTPTRYLQTQNDNLRNEYTPLLTDVPTSIPFARIALGDTAPLDALNFWLGNSFSTTALHKDNYENIYCQILGQKNFVLLPPVEAACVNERAVLAATYFVETGGTSDSNTEDLSKEDLKIGIDVPEEYTPFATWDPDFPDVNATPYSHLSRPLRVTLEEGDMLYLPALWYHKVTQSCNDEGICCAVNYWYDVDFSGGFWSMANFIRGVGLVDERMKAE